MSLTGANVILPSVHYLPIPKRQFESGHQLPQNGVRKSRFERIPFWNEKESVFSNQNQFSELSPTAFSFLEVKKPLSRFMPSWETENQSASRKDDGVVLLVGLFNLLAVIIYASREFLIGKQDDDDQRVVLWQVQKVLDELVLKVHSSDSAANLISRAFKTPSRASRGRSLSTNTIGSVVESILHEDDPRKLQKWLNNVRNNLLIEVSNSTYSLKDSHMNKKFYRPLQRLYSKITQTTRRGRSFSTSLLQEVSATARAASKLSLTEFQNILKLVSSLGKMRRKYDVLSLIKQYLPSKPIKSEYGLETTYHFPSNKIRSKRSPIYNSRTRKQRMNSKYPRLDTLTHMPMKKKDNKPEATMKMLGSVHSIHPDYVSTSNWADKWFSLLTELSPIALDFTTLYSAARSQPSCLRSLLCKSNNYWRKKGTLQASVTPFLSLIASWAMEDTTLHSLGDSLIAIRAGWMEKKCYFLYPECQTGGSSTEPNLTTYKIRSPLHSPTDRPQKIELVKLPEQIELKQEPQNKYQVRSDDRENLVTKSSPDSRPHAHLQERQGEHDSRSRDSIISAPVEPTATSRTPHEIILENLDPKHQFEEFGVSDSPSEEKPYDRYDNPNNPEDAKEMELYGSISGMNLQDRPVRRWQEKVEYVTPQGNTIEASAEHLVDNQATESRHSEVNQNHDRNILPDFFRGQMYSTYMQSQKPTFAEQIYPSKESYKPKVYQPIAKRPTSTRNDGRKRRIKYKINNKQKKQYLDGQISKPVLILENDIPKPVTPSKVFKYKYGVRRGLPAGNVDRLEQLQLPQQLPTSPEELKINRSLPKQYHKRTYKKRQQKSTPKTNEFQLTDAITDEHKNNLLYQYIRDRKVRHIPLQSRRDMTKLMNYIIRNKINH